ncbi:hypothetical protein CBS101457_002055 [Exobasidium rhododendri]|nr:hypothetical protein CBS101457_002055 [Exobasidium rhododendri]
MGRKARNKQQPPAPLSEFKKGKYEKGKRKAEDDGGRSKKARVSGEKVKKVNVNREPLGVRSSSSGKPSQGTKPKIAVNGNPKKVQEVERKSLFEDDDDDDEEATKISDGEDEDDDDDEDGFPGLDAEDFDDEDEEEGSDEEDYSDADDAAEGAGSEEEEDKDAVEGEQEEELNTDEELQKLGMPKKGTKLTDRQKKKALAEAERLEELLKSQGHSLEGLDDDDDDDEDGSDDEEEGDLDLEGLEGSLNDDDDELNDDEMAFLDGAEEEEEEDDSDNGEEEDLEDGEEDDLEDDVMLPTIDGGAAQDVDLQAVQMRIQEIVTILGNFKSKGSKGGRSRSEYTEQLLDDICNYYGYNRFLAEKFFELFSPSEAIEFFEANETPRPVTIRANTLRTRRRDLAQALINRGVNLEPIAGKWTKVGLQVFESSVPIGATPEYLAGHYMLQAASSFLPCIALAPQPNERVLDMASAPGGKSTYLSALMQNTGVIFANDSNKARTKSLSANIHRLGCSNVVVCNYDARMFPKVIGGFDRVLLDSPCSGSGVVSKDASVKTNKSERDLQLLCHLQKQLILCAIDSINSRSKTGGYLVYSTCSVLVEENEQIVQYALEKRKNVKIVNSGVEIGRDGFKSFRGKTFDEKMNFAKRIFPHVHNMDGFFFCKLKVEPRQVKVEAIAKQAKEDGEVEQVAGLDATTFDNEEDVKLMQKTQKRIEKKKGKKV